MRLLGNLSEAIHSVFMRPGVLIQTLLAAILGQMMFAGAAWSLARSLGVEIGMIDCLVIMQLVALVTALPISVGGWGAREVSMVGLLGLIGVASSAALLLSVELGLVGLLVNLPGGLVWLAARPQEKSGPVASATQV
jgi:glycosyltransferase 2 family protein